MFYLLITFGVVGFVVGLAVAFIVYRKHRRPPTTVYRKHRRPPTGDGASAVTEPIHRIKIIKNLKTKDYTIKNKAYNLPSYNFSSGNKILIDANIWLYIFPAPGSTQNHFARQYSSAFLNIIKAKAKLVTDPMVLSEYVNRYCRNEYDSDENYRQQYETYKQFRCSDDFKPIAEAAKTRCSKIMKICRIHSLPPDKLDLEYALNAFASTSIDFNDAILVDICAKRNLMLMTNDADFQRGGIEILTANQKLLRVCGKPMKRGNRRSRRNQNRPPHWKRKPRLES